MDNMNSYADIITFYNNIDDRNIDYLANIYKNKSFLNKSIKSFINTYIDNDSINNKKVLLKPNWVLNNKKDQDDICLRTNNSITLALLEIILSKNPKSVIIGDAPVQGSNWNKMMTDSFQKSIKVLSKEYNIPVFIKDFRRRIFNTDDNRPITEINPISEYVIFDLGKESYLEPISNDRNIFRVTSYNPDRLAESHKTGVHKYCIAKELFDTDIVISLPKIKTHQKAGITCALKNLVGLNGDKDFLPHHRIGGTGFGGDCYPGKNLLRLSAEYIMDSANRQQGKWTYKPLVYSSAAFWKLSMPKKVHQMAAGWYGNDTTWRMVMDLNKIAVYGRSDGTITKTPQRQLYSLCDGIIAGQGDGPLNPEPLPLGILSFTNHNGLNDICMATLMGFDYKKIALLKNQNIDFSDEKFEICVNGNKISIYDLSKFAIKTIPPPGWVNYLNEI